MQRLSLRLKLRSAREASHHPAFMGNCPTVSLIYQGDEFFFSFLVKLNKVSTLGESKDLSFDSGVNQVE